MAAKVQWRRKEGMAATLPEDDIPEEEEENEAKWLRFCMHALPPIRLVNLQRKLFNAHARIAPFAAIAKPALLATLAIERPPLQFHLHTIIAFIPSFSVGRIQRTKLADLFWLPIHEMLEVR